MGVPISLFSCRWFTEEEVERWLTMESRPRMFGTDGKLSYMEYARRLSRSSLKHDDKHKGKIAFFEKVKDGRVSRTQYVDRANDGLLLTSSSKNLFGRAVLKMSPRFYPLGVQRHVKYGKCLLSAPAKIMTVFVTLDGVPQRLCRQHGHLEHIPDSFFSWAVTNENEQAMIDIPLWNPEEISPQAPDILKCGNNTPISTPRGTPMSNGRSSRKGRWVTNLSHGGACAKAFHDFIRSLPNGNHEINIAVGFMYSMDELLLLPLERHHSDGSSHVWRRDLISGAELTSVDLSKEKTILPYPLMLATGTLKLHKS